MLTRLSKCLAAATAWLLMASAASAQFYGLGGWVGGWGGCWGPGSTPMGSYMAGMGEAIRAEGQYNLMSSQAAINLQEAQSQNIDNQLKWTNTYFEMRRVNEAYANSSRGPRLSSDTLARMARDAAPARMSSDALDPVTGDIAWPRLLQNEQFAPDRDAISRLFTDRAAMEGAVGHETYSQIRQAVDTALGKLKEQIRDHDSRSYLEARNFLRSLANEASFPTTAS